MRTMRSAFWSGIGAEPQASTDLPAEVDSLAEFVKAPPALARRLAMIGVVDASIGKSLQAQLSPGQRLVSIDGDLWRWDGYRAGAEDAPSSAALRLQQLNRLEELKQELQHNRVPRRTHFLCDVDRGVRQVHKWIKILAKG